jgi:quinol-cytochrome oxidoreductase complex cytochrome b subunit
MIFTAFAHMFSVLFFKAYRKPRELTWVSGVILLFLVMGFGFSGYLLPWNTLAFFATKVGTEITGQVPVIGRHLMIFFVEAKRSPELRSRDSWISRCRLAGFHVPHSLCTFSWSSATA